MDKESTLQKQTGTFKPKTKFIEFIGGKGYVNFISNEATISIKELSGIYYDDITLKLTIFEDGTVDLDEVDTSVTTQEERHRLLETIEDLSLGSYRSRNVINELMFTSVQKVKDKNVPLYLAVEYQKPIEKLGSLFEDSNVEISDSAMNNIDSLINIWFDDEESETDTESDDETSFIPDKPMDEIEEVSVDLKQKLETSFDKMKEEKLQELKDKKTKTENEISKLEYQISTLQNSISTAKSDLDLIEERIFDIQPKSEPNGYFFNVSERLNEVISLDPETERIIKDKVSKVKSINLENFMKLFTDGEFNINISKKTNTGFETIESYKDLPEDIEKKLDFIALDTTENKLIYNGELSWGELVNKMVKLGFEQNADFDKFCGSNSYSSNQETKEKVKTKKTKF